jgi:hypothetical protein
MEPVTGVSVMRLDAPWRNTDGGIEHRRSAHAACRSPHTLKWFSPELVQNLTNIVGYDGGRWRVTPTVTGQMV